MISAKDIIIKPIASKDANRLVKKLHYSGKVVNNSTLHFGVFLNNRLEGVMSFGNSLDKRKIQGLVKNTGWNDFIELNRMAFSEKLPRNSESRALSIAIRLIKKHYPHIEWIISFADGTQCGDGTIYRASGFILTAINKNKTMLRLSDGTIGASVTFTKNKYILSQNGRATLPEGAQRLEGYMFRYIYFLNKEAKERLTVPILPFSKIDEMGAGMYKGNKRAKKDASEHHSDSRQCNSDLPAPTLK